MGMSLAFHIIFAVVGIAMPLLMVIAEGIWLKTGKPIYRELAYRWSKGTAIMFAVGAVSGTVLSFELGLLWPTFMEHAGPVIGMPFSLEGFAFFLEAIFLGVYLYGWDKVPDTAHWASGFMVLVSGTLSGIFVVTANAWMNSPAGFDYVDGTFTNIRPFEAMFNPMWFSQTLHMTIAAFVAVGFAVAGIHALLLLKDRDHPFHRKAMAIALTVGGIFAFLQPISGDISAKAVADTQPVKLAAMEAQWETEKGAPLRIGGWPDEEAEETRWAIGIPKALSFLAHGDFNAEVKGLKEFPEEDRPPVWPVHLSFQIMVGIGFFLMGVALLAAWLAWRKKGLPDRPWFLKLVAFSTPLGLIAVEAGWMVTEIGRQPWIIQGIMRTEEAVTPMPNLQVPFLTFTVLYLMLAVIVVYLLWRHVFQTVDAEAFVEKLEADQAEEVA
jgi:cytochrome d ubiquinol oxidase subunit I